MPYVKLNGVNIYYDVTGNGYPLVFIHAGGMDSSIWRSQVSFFSKNYRIITYDLRGHGRSEVQEVSYSIDDCLEDLRQLLDFLSLQRVYLAWLSMGGYIILKFALCYPETVDALIIAGSNSGPMTELVVSKREEMADKIKLTQGVDSATKYMKAYEANASRPDITDRLTEINKPTLIIVGDRDMAAPPYISETMHRKIAHSQMAIISNCGHRCNIEQADRFNSLVSEFLRKIQAA